MRFIKWAFAAILIFFGGVLILQNLNFISLEISNIVWDSWPAILVFLGFYLLVNSFRRSRSTSWFFSSFLIIFGGLLWAGNFDYIAFTFSDIWKLWPLILIYIGANMLFGRKAIKVEVIKNDNENSYGSYKKKYGYSGKSKKEKNNYDDYDDYIEDTLEDVEDSLEGLGQDIKNSIKAGIGESGWKYHKSFEEDEEWEEDDSTAKKKEKEESRQASGKYKYNIKSGKQFVTDLNLSSENWEVQPMDLWTGIGDVNIDFSKGFIPNKETAITLRGYVADIMMKIPESVAVKIYTKVNIGDVEVFGEERSGFHNEVSYQSENYKEATRKLNIYASYKVGNIIVLSV
ncbi:cell wall-active antibiotics response protein LiaF [Halalkalibacillus halophilus]|uniref:cell wall-active antibiotics response protein LiaF n=1 Tax=Halalkalibacillus halophilus TaxID=392827 RepID=UPI000489360A|nr:cell wall-active antibiotics response protein LiaF [Halalkalibacillus halophilus]